MTFQKMWHPVFSQNKQKSITVTLMLERFDPHGPSFWRSVVRLKNDTCQKIRCLISCYRVASTSCVHKHEERIDFFGNRLNTVRKTVCESVPLNPCFSAPKPCLSTWILGAHFGAPLVPILGPGRDLTHIRFLS